MSKAPSTGPPASAQRSASSSSPSPPASGRVKKIGAPVPRSLRPPSPSASVAKGTSSPTQSAFTAAAPSTPGSSVQPSLPSSTNSKRASSTSAAPQIDRNRKNVDEAPPVAGSPPTRSAATPVVSSAASSGAAQSKVGTFGTPPIKGQHGPVRAKAQGTVVKTTSRVAAGDDSDDDDPNGAVFMMPTDMNFAAHKFPVSAMPTSSSSSSALRSTAVGGPTKAYEIFTPDRVRGVGAKGTSAAGWNEWDYAKGDESSQRDPSPDASPPHLQSLAHFEAEMRRSEEHLVELLVEGRLQEFAAYKERLEFIRRAAVAGTAEALRKSSSPSRVSGDSISPQSTTAMRERRSAREMSPVIPSDLSEDAYAMMVERL